MIESTAFDIARLVAPNNLQDFLDQHWERAPLHIARNDPDFYADLLSLADLDTLLTQSRPTARDLRVLSKEHGHAYGTLHDMERTPGECHRGPHLRPLHQAYDDGNSIVAQIRRQRPGIDRLCRSAEQLLRRRASAELYLTPRHSQAFDVHFDLHDVFLLQLEGAKTWHVYEPFVDDPSSFGEDDRLCADRVGAPKHVFEVRKGDLLYMPRSFPHQGLTSGEPSLHVTIGVSALRLHDLMAVLVETAARENTVLRRSLRGAFATAAEAGVDTATIAECLRLLHDERLLERAVRHIEDGFLDGLDPVPDGQFAELDGIDGIDRETPLEHRTDQICSVRADAGSATIRFIGGGVSGPPWLDTPLRWIAATSGFRPDEIPGEMSLDSKLVLARRLVREGLLRRVRRTEDGAP